MDTVTYERLLMALGEVVVRKTSTAGGAGSGSGGDEVSCIIFLLLSVAAVLGVVRELLLECSYGLVDKGFKCAQERGKSHLIFGNKIWF